MKTERGRNNDFQVFRKGQIFPRRLSNARTQLKKAQHCITFGADTVYCNGVFYSDTRGGGAVIVIRQISRKRHNGTRQKSYGYFRNIVVVNPKHNFLEGIWPARSGSAFKLFQGGIS